MITYIRSWVVTENVGLFFLNLLDRRWPPVSCDFQTFPILQSPGSVVLRNPGGLLFPHHTTLSGSWVHGDKLENHINEENAVNNCTEHQPESKINKKVEIRTVHWHRGSVLWVDRQMTMWEADKCSAQIFWMQECFLFLTNKKMHHSFHHNKCHKETSPKGLDNCHKQLIRSTPPKEIRPY